MVSLATELRHTMLHSKKRVIGCAECKHEHYELHWIGVGEEDPMCAYCIVRIGGTS